MPLTKKGQKVLSNMKDEYGSKKGEQVFYASANKGTIKGVHEATHDQLMDNAKLRFMEGMKGAKPNGK